MKVTSVTRQINPVTHGLELKVELVLPIETVQTINDFTFAKDELETELGRELLEQVITLDKAQRSWYNVS